MHDRPYKVVLVAAGTGSRLAPLTDNVNKALLPVAGKAIISHIIEKFSPDVPIVLALGYEKEKIIEYLTLAHPDREFTFVTVDNYDQSGSGPAYSLLACQEYLQCPFIFSTIDTLVTEDIPEPTQDWLGVCEVDDMASYNSVSLRNGFVKNMRDKVACDNSHAFIGLCGVNNYNAFWDGLSGNASLIAGEYQVSNGLRSLVEKGMAGVEFTWHDTGTLDEYKKTCEAYAEDEEFDFSKTSEFIYFIDKRVIKFFADSSIARARVQRASLLKGFVPKIVQHTEHFYAYDSVEGKTLYTVIHPQMAAEFFDWLAESFWTNVTSGVDEEEFRKACIAFYQDKTRRRIEDYYKRTDSQDTAGVVNGVTIGPLADLLEKINWHELTTGIASRWHGDLQYDNVLATGDAAQPFVLLDWRQDFAGLVKYGDRYYDLAKLYGGHIIPYNLIKKNMFSYTEQGDSIRFDMGSTYALIECRSVFESFIIEQGYDLQKVRVLTALIFLNMAPLHIAPFDKLLHHLGKLELMKALNLMPLSRYAQN